MPDEHLQAHEAAAPEGAEVALPADSGVTVEVEPEKGGKPAISDDELGKLTATTDDEIARADAAAKKAVRSLRQAYQEQRRRAEQWSKDAATASTLAEQLYRENQQLRQSNSRSESALIDQALRRAETQLDGAKNRLRQAHGANDVNEIVDAQEEMARSAAEVDRLKLLKPVAGEQAQPQEQPPGPMPQQQGGSARTQAWVAAHPWWGKDQEMTSFAMRQHHHLAIDGITEESNPDLYWRTIDERLARQYPDKFGDARPEGQARPRPVAVTGGTRSASAPNGSPASADGKRIVRLTESQVRIAKTLGLTPEQYALQLVKEEQEERRRVS